MDLFTRKMRLFCVSNIMVSFVCTGFIGVKGYADNTINSSENANEISLIASDTEPVSQNGEGEEDFFTFALKGIEIVFKQQDEIINGPKVVNNIIAKSDTNKKTTTTGSKKTSTNVVSKKEVKNTTTYAPASYSSVTGDAIVSYAKRYLGLRYKSGTPSLTNGADCSGFTMLIFREFGVSLSRTVGGQIGQGTYVNKGDLQKGDLVFYKAKGSRGGASHVGIYIGGGQVIHESRPGVGVKISSVNMMQYVTARRVINSKAKQIAEQKLEEEKKNEVVTDNTSTNNENQVDNNAVNNNAVDNNVVNNENNVNNETTIVDNNTSEVVNNDTPNTEVSEQPEIKEEPKNEEVVETEVSNTESS